MRPVPGVEGDPTLGRNKDETETNVRLKNSSLGLDIGLQISASQSRLPFSSPDYLQAPLCSASCAGAQAVPVKLRCPRAWSSPGPARRQGSAASVVLA